MKIKMITSYKDFENYILNNEDFKNYILFKMTQYTRLTNFDYKQIDVKNKLKQLCEPKWKEWAREALASLNYQQTN